ncbi:PEP-CTERM sorting domain-containing protein [Coleofasciculus sp. LEGE 07092]|uniref:PEP-CTERM sorting domain-containing protein n=1 Tax=Coleofasciculus sp. LEGE 07092 TaxID=2777969 RepID=UPI0018805313|nr:PEP-CTERM sorting domain-containing protein [Coleofasciculus sp. LEGE 07092]
MDGNLVAFDFLSFGSNNTPPAVTDATLFFNSSELNGASFRAGVSPNANVITIGSSSVTTEDINLTFTRLDDDTESVPEPTSILSLLVVGAVATGTTLKRKQV